MLNFARPQSRNDFTIAIICALILEPDAVEATFDEEWDPRTYGQAVGDKEILRLGGNRVTRLPF
jgi:hypothetical protein